MLNKLIRNKNLIILIWCVLILIIFKITTNFVFEHGSSILFLILFLGGPILLNYFANRKSKQLRKKRLARQAGFLDQIRFDIRNGTFQSLFLSSIMAQYGKPQMLIDEEEIKLYLSKEGKLQVTFTKEKATVSIIDTKVMYHFYYSKAFYDLSKYDERGFEYRGTPHLYQRMIMVFEKFISGTYQYDEVYYSKQYAGCILKRDDEVIYQLTEVAKKGFLQKERVINKEIII